MSWKVLANSWDLCHEPRPPSVPAPSVPALCVFLTQGPHSCKSHMRVIPGFLKSSVFILCGMRGSPRKAHTEQDNMHNSLSPLRKTCSKNVWGETDFSDLQGRWASISSRHPQGAEEGEHRLSGRPFLKWGCGAPALPGCPLTHAREKGGWL